MMTFKELKKLVKLPLYKEQRVPTVKALEESGVSVVAEKILENHGSISVYQNGYVIYRAHKRVTVFSLRNCVHYKYDALEGAGHHIEEEEFEEFRNSKYVQSRVGYAFQQVRNELKRGRMVCFSGTPCQIEGLRHFLGKDYQNLILVDVVCRAVPSPGVWEKYIQYEVEQKGKLSSIRFRDKSLGYQYSTMELRAENGKKYRGGIESQPWLRMFFSGMIIRPSCTDCRFRSRYRNSDFTIWDCFPSYKYDKSFDERKGTTRVLIHSEKGKKLFANIKNCFKYCEVSSDDVIQNVTEMVESPTFHSKRAEFFSEFRILEMPQLIQKYFPITLKLELKKYVRLGLNLVDLDRIIKRYIRN